MIMSFLLCTLFLALAMASARKAGFTRIYKLQLHVVAKLAGGRSVDRIFVHLKNAIHTLSSPLRSLGRSLLLHHIQDFTRGK
jgi:hypothetical protein